MKIIIVIPSLNPDRKLIKTIKELKDYFSSIIVVDDGSKKEYLEVFSEIENLGCIVTHHKINYGKGKALKTGIKILEENFPDTDAFITMDADGQHKVSDVLKIKEELEKDPDNIVLGSRSIYSKNVHFSTKIATFLTSMFFGLFTGYKFRDTLTGLRGIPIIYKKLALAIPGTRYDYEMNFLLEMALRRIDFTAVNIKYIYTEKKRVSLIDRVKDVFYLYETPIKFFASSLSSTAIDLILFDLLIKIESINPIFMVYIATYLARIVSSIINFTMNKKWVYKSAGKTSKEATGYTIVLVLKTIASSFIVSLFSFATINLTIIKMAVDSILFIINYYIQNKYIFKNEIDN